jgi:hypothetical protein
MFDQALRITFSRRVNLDDIGRAVTLLFQYAEVRLELGKLSAGEGIVVFRNGARRLLDREEAEELAEVKAAIQAAERKHLPSAKRCAARSQRRRLSACLSWLISMRSTRPGN